MANNRTFQVQGLTTNLVAVGGLASLNFAPSYRDMVVSSPDGAVGAEDVDRAGLQVDVSLNCSDVKKAAAILAATPGSTTFSAREAGAATWHNYTIDGGADGKIVWHGMDLTVAKAADATLALRGAILFASGSKTLADILAVAGAGAVAPTLTYPARLFRAHNFSFDPDGADPAIALSHLDSLTLSLAATEVLQDYGDDDIGMTSVDRGPWAPLGITISHGDASIVTAKNKNAELLAAGRGTLTVDLMGRAGGTDQTLTINNVLWSGAPQNEQSGYTEFQLAGQCGWRNGATLYNLLTAVGPPAYTALFEFGDES